MIQFSADRGDSQQRLDRVLVRHVREVSRMSRTRAQTWIAGGLVLVDGQPVIRSSVKVREGAAIEVAVPSSTRLRQAPGPEEIPLTILYEDEALLAVNKPPGLVVHPSYRNASGTLLNGVLWRFRDRPDVRPGLVQRLDKDTSGVLLIALSPAVHARVQRDTKAGRVTKQYIAIVRGTPKPASGTIALPLGRDPADRRRVVVAADGAPSETRYQVIGSGRGYAAVSCDLITGRTHQIRVHLAASGWPVAGDRTYGSADPAISRQALHAWRMALAHPVTGASLLLEAALPSDLRVLADRYGISC